MNKFDAKCIRLIEKYINPTANINLNLFVLAWAIFVTIGMITLLKIYSPSSVKMKDQKKYPNTKIINENIREIEGVAPKITLIK